jgi:hypothetical protein
VHAVEERVHAPARLLGAPARDQLLEDVLADVQVVEVEVQRVGRCRP